MVNIAISSEIIEEEYALEDGATAKIQINISLPQEARGRLPAIVVLHHAGGYDQGATKQYAEFFTQYGYVVAEPIMFRKFEDIVTGDQAQRILWATQKALQNRPEVNPSKIGVMGLSFGAGVAVFSATEQVSKDYGKEQRFAAHASLYGLCWIYREHAKGNPKIVKSSNVPREIWDKLTSAPVLFLVGEKDDYEPPNTCENFVNLIRDKQATSIMSIKVYEGASHGWDHGKTYSFEDPWACEGRGCRNTNRSDSNVTKQGMNDLLEFFDESLK